MRVKIITLCENTATFGCLAEWGLSLHIEVGTLRLLMDTGMSFCAVQNARELKVDLQKLDGIILSHGHIDHTGGLKNVLVQSGPKPIIAHPDIWIPKFSTRRKMPDKNIGFLYSKDVLQQLGASFTLTTKPYEVAPGILTSGEIPMNCEFETIDKGLFRKQQDIRTADPLSDDLALAIDTTQGLIIVLGCAHRGLVNTVEHFKNITGNHTIHAIIGGTHLDHASTERIEKTIEYLKDISPKKIACSHCTGFKAAALMKAQFQKTFVQNNAGTRLTFN